MTGYIPVDQDEDLAIYLNESEPEVGEIDENNFFSAKNIKKI